MIFSLFLSTDYIMQKQDKEEKNAEFELVLIFYLLV